MEAAEFIRNKLQSLREKHRLNPILPWDENRELHQQIDVGNMWLRELTNPILNEEEISLIKPPVEGIRSTGIIDATKAFKYRTGLRLIDAVQIVRAKQKELYGNSN